MEAIWLGLQQSGFAGLVRQSEFIYPAANVLHVVAVVAFYGLVAAMDFHVLATSGGAQLVKRLRPWAIAMLVVIAAAGFTLFSAEAAALAANPAFQLKLLAIALAVANFAVHVAASSLAVRQATAVMSLTVWLIVAALGRYIAYA
jgi:hypothetical protein